MSAAPNVPKRRHNSDKMRLGERRRGKDDGSSRDASEEDNEDELSDVGSLASSHHARLPSHPIGQPHPHGHAHSYNSAAPAINAVYRRALGHKKATDGGEGDAEGSQSDGVDSPVYDGDVESSSTIGGTPVHSTFAASGQFPHSHSHHTHPNHNLTRRSSSPTPVPSSASLTAPSTSTNTTDAIPMGRQPTPKASRQSLTSTSASPTVPAPAPPPADVSVAPSESLSPASKSQLLPLSTKTSMSALGPPKMTSRPRELTAEDIKEFVQRAIDGKGAQDGVERWWKTRPPPGDRPVRIYADGVYDLFHFGHALQLRQAKLSFPGVYLLVGVCSDKLCADHKSAPAMTHAERCEAVRHCRWADEVVPDAPWVVDQKFMDKYQIDYLAHDELVYPSKDCEDVYAFAKEQGMFLPTRRTPSISTSDLLERIVRGYRDGFFDSKLEKNGHPELVAADVDWDSSASIEKRERRKKGRGEMQPLSTGK